MQLLKGFGAHRGVRLVTVAMVVLMGSSRLASAQNMRGRGPFAGLFGMGPGASNSQSLDFRGSAFGVWQDVIFPLRFRSKLHRSHSRRVKRSVRESDRFNTASIAMRSTPTSLRPPPPGRLTTRRFPTIRSTRHLAAQGSRSMSTSRGEWRFATPRPLRIHPITTFHRPRSRQQSARPRSRPLVPTPHRT